MNNPFEEWASQNGLEMPEDKEITCETVHPVIDEVRRQAEERDWFDISQFEAQYASCIGTDTIELILANSKVDIENETVEIPYGKLCSLIDYALGFAIAMKSVVESEFYGEEK